MVNDSSIRGLRVAVTGGTSGLGLALVRLLSAEEAAVAFVARTDADVERVANETGAVGIVGDVSQKDAIYPIALQITANLGGLDILINNASSLGPVPLSPLADTDCEDLEEALRLNVLAPFRLTKALYGSLAASARQGRIPAVVNISSDAAINAYPTWGAYGASKAALRHLTAIWGEESNDTGIRFMSIDPGDMDTPLHALADPDADPATLKRPADSAADVVNAIQAVRRADGFNAVGVRP